jgi:hypothetical protein
MRGQIYALTALPPGTEFLMPIWLRGWTGPTTVVDSTVMNRTPIHRPLLNNHVVLKINGACFTVESESETIDNAPSMGCSSCLVDTEKKSCSEERLLRMIRRNVQARNIKIQAGHVNPSFQAHVLFSPQKINQTGIRSSCFHCLNRKPQAWRT